MSSVVSEGNGYILLSQTMVVPCLNFVGLHHSQISTTQVARHFSPSLSNPCTLCVVLHCPVCPTSHIPQLSRVFPRSCHAFLHVVHFADCAWFLVHFSPHMLFSQVAHPNPLFPQYIKPVLGSKQTTTESSSPSFIFRPSLS